MKIVSVDWLDSAHNTHWRDKEDIDNCKTIRCTTIGFRLRNGKHHGKNFIRLVQSHSDIDDIADIQSIPSSCVLSIKELGVKNGN